MRLTLHIDGGARGNPGPAAAGVCLTDSDDGAPLFEAGFFLGTTTNNVAEYQGLLRGLDAALKLKPQALLIRADSELMVRQIHGQYRVKAPNLKPLHQQAVAKLNQLRDWSFDHVRRHHNTRADELANMAMDAKSDVIVTPLPI